MLPVGRAAAPAERKRAINYLAKTGFGAIAQDSEIGDKAGIPEQNRNRTVGRDREHVPFERTAVVLPHVQIGIWNGEEPVDGAPGTAGMEQREDGGAGYGENCHRFSGAVNSRSPLLAEKKQNGGNQGAGVADTDPPDEVGNVPGPSGGTIVSPDADAAGHQISQAGEQQQQQRAGD